MTMLDRMRQHKNWLKWSLGVVVLAFVGFYIPDFLTSAPGAAPTDIVASVEGRDITSADSAASISNRCSRINSPTAASSTTSCSDN